MGVDQAIQELPLDVRREHRRGRRDGKRQRERYNTIQGDQLTLSRVDKVFSYVMALLCISYKDLPFNFCYALQLTRRSLIVIFPVNSVSAATRMSDSSAFFSLFPRSISVWKLD